MKENGVFDLGLFFKLMKANKLILVFSKKVESPLELNCKQNVKKYFLNNYVTKYTLILHYQDKIKNYENE